MASLTPVSRASGRGPSLRRGVTGGVAASSSCRSWCRWRSRLDEMFSQEEIGKLLGQMVLPMTLSDLLRYSQPTSQPTSQPLATRHHQPEKILPLADASEPPAPTSAWEGLSFLMGSHGI